MFCVFKGFVVNVWVSFEKWIYVYVFFNKNGIIESCDGYDEEYD